MRLPLIKLEVFLLNKLSKYQYCALMITTGVSLLCGVLAPVTPALAADTGTPVWTDLGSGQIRSNDVNDSVNVEGMASTSNPTTGAITKVLVDPGNTSIIYAGAVNGGIWKTTDNGANWSPLTDRLSSLSIGAMNFDSTDTTNQTIIAGIGRQSAFNFVSGPLTGIQYSTNGGTTWVEKRGTAADIYGKDITGVAARGNIMMAAVRDMSTPITTVGLYRSTDGGTTFSNSVTGLPVGNIQNLAADPTNTSRFYLSVVNGNDTMTGIYRSDDTGASWTQIKAVAGLKANETVKADGRILLSVGAGGVLIAQVQQGRERLEILRTADQGGTWTDLGKPATPNFTGLFPGNQPEVHGAVLADPNDSNVVYAAGDTQYTDTNSSIGANQWTCPIFRGVYDPVTGGTTWTYITNDNTLSNSAPHADSRTFFIDSNGRLLFGGDGGLCAYSYPATTKQYDWFPIMNNLRTTEMTQSCWNSITHTVSAAAQDVGAYYQFPGQKGSYDWSSTSGGDGGPGPVNSLTYKGNPTPTSVVYASSQYLSGFRRFEVGTADDAAASAKTRTLLKPYFKYGGNNIEIVGEDAGYMSFLSTVALNRTDPLKMAIGGYNLFVGTDDPTKNKSKGFESYEFLVTSVLPGLGNLPTNNQITSLAYGTNIAAGVLNPQETALLAGSGNFYKTTDTGYLYYTPIAGTTDMTSLSKYAGKYVWKAIFDERDGNKFYVADGTDVWRSSSYTTGDLTTFAKINGEAAGKLPDTFVDRRGLTFASANGVNALFVGGVSNIKDGSGIYVTRFTPSTASDPINPTLTSWSSFGGNLANAPVYGLSYDTTDDVLLVNLLGRGAWTVYDLTSYFPEATRLLFGKANNDSAPAASLLTNGTLVGGSTFDRGLTKSGTGTLYLSGTSTYSGTTTISSGVLSIASTASLPGWKTDGSYSVASGAALAVGNGVSELEIGARGSPNTILNTTNFADGASLGFDTSLGNRNYASIIGDTSADKKLGLIKIGANTLTLSGTNTYTGVTTISSGILRVNTINNGGVDGNMGQATSAAANLVLDGGTLQYAGVSDSTDRAFTITAAKTGIIDVSTAGSTLTIFGASAATTGGLTKTGLGTLLLSGANAYTGATTVNAGKLQAGSITQAFGNGSAVTVGAAGTLDLGGYNETIGSLAGAAGGIVTNTGAAGTLTAGDTTSTTFSGVIKDGTGMTNLVKQGVGTLTLSGTNTYSGTTTISSGVLSIAGTNSLPGWNTNGKYSVTNGTALAVGNGVSDANIGANGSTGTILGTSNFEVWANIGFDTSAGNRTYTNVIGNTVNGALGLVKVGVNTLTLSGTNTYIGATTICDGNISVQTIGNGGVAGNLGAAASDATNLVFNGGTLQYTGDTASTNRNFTISASTIATIQVDTAGKTLTMSGASPATTGGLTKAGAGTLLLSGANLYTGATTVSAGTLKAGAATTVFGNKSNVILNNKDGGGLNLNNLNITIGPLDGVLNSTVALGSGALTITNGTSTSGNYGGVISGTGGLTVAGTGTGVTQVLTGANTYTGTTTISGTSTLQVGDVVSGAANTGTLGTGAVTNDATLTFNRTNNLIVSNAISGSGVLKQIGTGILTLSGDNKAYSGTTTISSGVLSITSTDSLPGFTTGKYSVAKGATLAVYNEVTDGSITTMLATTNFAAGAALGFDTATTTTRTYSAILANTGQGQLGLTKLGAGTLTLSGTNTYTGATTITAGTLIANSSAALGDSSATNILTFNGGTLQAGGAITSEATRLVTLASTGIIDTNGNAVSIAGVMSGAGGLTKAGADTLTLSGANTYTGATTVNAGTLKAGVASVANTSGAFGNNSAVILANNASTNLDITGKDTQIGSITGGGTTGGNVTLGAATLTVGGDNSSPAAYAGKISGTGAITKIGFGTQIFSGANDYTGGTTINASGGTLQVTSAKALGSGNVTLAEGTFGAVCGTLDVGTTALNIGGGTYTQKANAILKFAANSNSDCGTITSVGGSVAGTITPTVSGYFSNNATLNIINGTTGSLTYDTTTSLTPYSHYTFTGAESGGILTLTLSRATNGFASEAANSNEANVGNILDNVNNPTSDMTTVLNTLEDLNDAQTDSALNSVEPDTDGSSLQVTQATLNQLTDAVLGHQESLRNGPTGVSTGDDMLKGVDVWAEGFGSYLHQDPRQSSKGYNANIWGTALGFDVPAISDIRVGACFGFAQDYVRGKDNSNRNDINSYQWTIYGEYVKDALYLDLLGSFAYNTYDATRQVAVGPIQRTASADYSGEQYQLYTEAGYILNCRKELKLKSDLNITPLVSFQYQHLYLDKYTESGAGALNLSVNRQNYDFAQTGFGVKFDYPLNTKHGRLVPELRVKWLYDWIGDAQQNASTFTGGGGSFATNGFNPAQSSWDFGAKLTMFTKNNVTVAINYDLELKEDFYGHYGYVNAKYSF
ncbi:MAG: autotransporter-associated beta strand repeat-containing protein [Candidatus Omnitrophica bacterium]|nr:autotransporter-associated beta strand repeat-containing protein [Candidatus Omnitrophota bacterium]